MYTFVYMVKPNICSSIMIPHFEIDFRNIVADGNPDTIPEGKAGLTSNGIVYDIHHITVQLIGNFTLNHFHRLLGITI